LSSDLNDIEGFFWPKSTGLSQDLPHHMLIEHLLKIHIQSTIFHF